MFEFFLDLIEQITEHSRSLSRKQRQMIHDQILYAINQTKVHMQATSINGKDRSSTSLSNIWQRSAAKVKRVNSREVSQLAKTIEEKAKYWSDTEGYDRDNFVAYHMRINEVEQTLNQLCK